MRIDGRKEDEMREIKIERNILEHPQGSVLIQYGKTKVICTAMIEEKTPFFLRGTGKGWLVAEYSMLPSSTNERKVRDSTRGKVDGRTQEIQRMIGRVLRSVVDLKKIGERTIWVDCDVIQADGGTRTASVTGAFVALHDALKKIKCLSALKSHVAAVSLGVVDDKVMMDLCYQEDSRAQVDMNVAMTDKGEIIEIQGTGEQNPFSASQLTAMIEFATKGTRALIEKQKEALRENRKIILSTGNPNKVREIKEILKDINLRIFTKDEVGLKDLDVEESGKTLEENAMIKARAIWNARKGIVMADDTGLFVDALGDNEPGVYSSRYAGDNATDKDNRIKLLDRMKGRENRAARFRTVIALIMEDGSEIYLEGECKGRITESEIGNNGFGYDSIFIPEGYGETFGQLSSEVKDKISHRAKALESLKEYFEKR